MSLQYIPNELLVNIFHQLTSLKDVLNCRLVCRHWNNLLQHFGTNIVSLYYNVSKESIKLYQGQNMIIQNKQLRRRNLKYLFSFMPKLKRLGIFGFYPRPIVYDLLGDYFPHLQGLCLIETTLSEDAFFRLMKSLPNLEVLKFTRKEKESEKEPLFIDITQGLQVATNLKSIYLSGHFILDESLQLHESLEELEIDLIDDYTYLLNYDFLLQKCRTNLKRFSIHGLFPLVAVFQNKFPKLEHFELNRRDAHDGEVKTIIEALLEAHNLTTLPNLKTLVIKFFDEITHRGNRNTSEQELAYATSDMQMRLINFLPNLSNLCLDSCCNLKILSTKCPHIQKLQFNGSLTLKLEDSTCHLFGNFKNLKELILNSCFITKDAIRIIVDSCATLEKLYIDGPFIISRNEARTILLDHCEKKNRFIEFGESARNIEPFWRDNWLNQFR